MPTSPARTAAFGILLRVEERSAYASELLHSSRTAKLSRADHRLMTELVMGVLRWQSWLDQEIAKRSSLTLNRLDTEVLTSLRLAAYQLLFLDRIPAHAAIHESVELVKRAGRRSAASFTNAVLRKLGSPKSTPPPPSAIADSRTSRELAKVSAHPQWLIERWIQEFDIDVARKVCGCDQQIPATTIRMPDSSLELELENAGVELGPGSLLRSARRIVAGDLSRTKVFRDGRVTIQDEASQLVALLVGRGNKILDCCAAPGGKTRVLAERNPSATILAAELHPHRARLLRQLVRLANVQVVAADARTLPTSALFDRVLVDAPCSGTGTLARNPEIKWRLEPKDLLDLHSRQVAILRSATRHVAPNGELVYATCSLEPEENQEVVESTLAADSSFHVLDCRRSLEQLCTEGELTWTDLDSLVSGPYLRTLPGTHPCDGFFAAILQKI